MLRRCVPFILLVCLAVAGCWQTRTRPYGNVIAMQPFAAGTVTATDRDGKVTHYALRKIDRGRYRLTLSDRGQDFGQGFEVGFFPLSGAPSRVLILQMAMLNFHTGDDNLRYYGLLVVTGKNSAQEIVPDCDKDARRARVPAADKDNAGTCTFPDRASLEKSLLALWKSGKKPDTSLSLEAAIGSPR
ncbi:MAG TPA: hypothetical protein VHX18_13145 [Rhizomicrobium sp.]|jgi:hypothetical protein|nr:hypothetical protein [Rhizomicrobium sp.]